MLYKNNGEKFFQFLLLAILIIGILPFFVLSVYNHPYADDYWFANVVREQGFLKAQVHWYTQVSGRFVTMFINSLNPLTFNSIILYKILPILHLSFFIVMVGISINNLAGNYINKFETFLLSLGILFIFIYNAFSVRQAFYWLPSFSNYMVPSLLVIYALSLLYKVYLKPYRYRLIFYLICVLSFLIAGLNETPSIIFCAVLSFILFFRLIKLKKIDFKILIVLGFNIMGIVWVLMSGGTDSRVEGEFSVLENTNRYNLTFTFVSSLKSTVLFLFNRLNSIMIPMTILFLPILNKMIIKSNLKSMFIHPFLAISILTGLIFIAYLPAFWFLGTNPYPRIQNAIYLLFIISFIYFILCILNYFYPKKNITLNIHPVISVILMIYIIAGIKNSNTRKNNIAYAYEDILNGSAKNFNSDMKGQYSELRNCTVKNSKCVTYIRNKAHILDYRPNPEDSQNSFAWKLEYFKSLPKK